MVKREYIGKQNGIGSDKVINMQGYVKPETNEISDIDPTDSLNEAMGKLENKSKFKLNTVGTIEELKSINAKEGDVYEVLGYYNIFDGATHKRVISNEDDGSGVQLENGKFANIMYTNIFYVKWFGVNKDNPNNNNTECFDKCISYLKKINLQFQFAGFTAVYLDCRNLGKITLERTLRINHSNAYQFVIDFSGTQLSYPIDGTAVWIGRAQNHGMFPIKLRNISIIGNDKIYHRKPELQKVVENLDDIVSPKVGELYIIGEDKYLCTNSQGNGCPFIDYTTKIVKEEDLFLYKVKDDAILCGQFNPVPDNDAYITKYPSYIGLHIVESGYSIIEGLEIRNFCVGMMSSGNILAEYDAKKGSIYGWNIQYHIVLRPSRRREDTGEVYLRYDANNTSFKNFLLSRNDYSYAEAGVYFDDTESGISNGTNIIFTGFTYEIMGANTEYAVNVHNTEEISDGTVRGGLSTGAMTIGGVEITNSWFEHYGKYGIRVGDKVNLKLEQIFFVGSTYTKNAIILDGNCKIDISRVGLYSNYTKNVKILIYMTDKFPRANLSLCKFSNISFPKRIMNIEQVSNYDNYVYESNKNELIYLGNGKFYKSYIDEFKGLPSTQIPGKSFNMLNLIKDVILCSNNKSHGLYLKVRLNGWSPRNTTDYVNCGYIEFIVCTSNPYVGDGLRTTDKETGENIKLEDGWTQFDYFRTGGFQIKNIVKVSGTKNIFDNVTVNDDNTTVEMGQTTSYVYELNNPTVIIEILDWNYISYL